MMNNGVILLVIVSEARMGIVFHCLGSLMVVVVVWYSGLQCVCVLPFHGQKL